MQPPRPINVSNVTTTAGNILAGVKILRNIEDQYFNDPEIAPVDKTLMALASYNAGPNRIARLRQQAKDQGLDPNTWFGNVELMVAKQVGQETVTYVGNVYKYYVAYKRALEHVEAQPKVMHSQGSWLCERSPCVERASENLFLADYRHTGSFGEPVESSG